MIYGETQDDIISINASTGVEHSLASTTEGEGLFRGDGVLYGTTTGSGAAGTIFAFGPKTKAVTTLYSLQGASQNDGRYPVRGLTVGKHKLYGATGGGGQYQQGTVFSFDLKTQAETVLYNFAGGDDGGRARMAMAVSPRRAWSTRRARSMERQNSAMEKRISGPCSASTHRRCAKTGGIQEPQ